MMPRLRRLGAMNRSYRRTRLRLLAGVSGAGLRLEPDGCHLFPADDSGTSAVREYASA
jgi:hypothetical protein